MEAAELTLRLFFGLYSALRCSHPVLRLPQYECCPQCPYITHVALTFKFIVFGSRDFGGQLEIGESMPLVAPRWLW